MKLLYVTPGEVPSGTANSIHVMKMSAAFAAHGQEVTLIFSTKKSICPQDCFRLYGVNGGFKLFRVPHIPFGFNRLFFAISTALFAVVSRFQLVFSRCVPTAYFCGLLGRSFVIEIHDSPYSFGLINRWMFFRLLSFRGFRGIVVISSALCDHISELTGVSPHKIITLHDGADPIQDTKIQRIKGKEFSCHAGYTGHLYHGRGIELILEIATQLPDVFFHIVGGTDSDVERYQEKCNTPNVHFYGLQPHNAVSSFLLSFDILLAPYQDKVSVSGNQGNTASWMSPLKIFEYMSSGKPIICSDLPVLREVLSDKANAVLCPYDDVSCWLDAINRLRSEDKFAEKLGKTALKTFLAQYTWHARAAKILQFLKVS